MWDYNRIKAEAKQGRQEGLDYSTVKDLEQWRVQFEDVDVDNELQGISERSQVRPLKKKQWFFQVANALNKAQQAVF